MILYIDNLQSLAINGVVYTRQAHTWGSGRWTVRAIEGGMLHPDGSSPAAKPQLVVDGPVYIVGAGVHATGSQAGEFELESYPDGGYLETVTNFAHVIEYDLEARETESESEEDEWEWIKRAEATIQFRTLGIRPAAYSGGNVFRMEISGINRPAAADIVQNTGRTPFPTPSGFDPGTLFSLVGGTAPTSFRTRLGGNTTNRKILAEACNGYCFREFHSGYSDSNTYAVGDWRANWIGANRNNCWTVRLDPDA